MVGEVSGAGSAGGSGGSTRTNRLARMAHVDDDDSGDSAFSDDESESAMHLAPQPAAGALGPPSEWLYGKPAHARLPQEVRLSEGLEWKLQRLCARGGGEFSVRQLPPGVPHDGGGRAGTVSGSVPDSPLITGGRRSDDGGRGGGGELTLVLGRAALHLRTAAWGAPKRAQSEYALGVGVSIEHWARDNIVLYLPAAGGDELAAEDETNLQHAGPGRQPRALGRAASGIARAAFQGGVGVGGEATGGVDLRLEVLGGREQRDLCVLSLRFLVASAFGGARR